MNLRRINYTALLIFLFFSVGMNAQMETLATWNFESSSTNPTTGTGTFTVNSGTNIQTDSGGPYYNGASSAAQTCPITMTGKGYGVTNFSTSNTSKRGITLGVNTTGYSSLILEFDLRQSGSSPNSVGIYASINGAAAIPIALSTTNTTSCLGSIQSGVFVANTTSDVFRRFSIDLAAFTQLNNISNLKLEIVAVGDPSRSNTMTRVENTNSPATTGAWRFDNIRISGSKKITAQLSGDATICTPSSTSIQATILGGTSPYTLIYTDGTNNFTRSNYVSGTTITVNPTVTTTYTLVSVKDANNNSALSADLTGSALITVNPGVIPGNIQGFTPAASNFYSLFTCFGDLLSDNIALVNYTGTISKWMVADNTAFTTNLQEFTGTDYLTPSQIGIINAPKYIRAVVTSNGCSSVNVQVNITQRTVTWNGSLWSGGNPDSKLNLVVDAPLTITSLIEGCAMTVKAGKSVVVASGATLALNGKLTVESGASVIFEDGASLVQNLDVTNSGNITYKRKTTPVRRYDYTYWSSPVNAQILSNLSPLTLSDKYYWWDTSLYNWANIAAPGITVMENGKGYIIRSPQSFDINSPEIFEGGFNGTPNNGTVTIPIFVNGAQNLNLIGNPYPSAVDADLFLSEPANATSLGLGASLYFWTHNTPLTNLQYSFSDYAVYNYTGGLGTAPASGPNNNIPDGNIAAGQAFFVEAKASGTAQFNNRMRLNSNNDKFYRQTSAEKDRYWLEISHPQNGFKQALVGYVTGATSGLDRGFDAPIANGTNSVQLYTLAGSEALSIQGRSWPLQLEDSVRLGYVTQYSGIHTLSLAKFEGVFQTQEIYLSDRQTGLQHNLSHSDYTFHSEIGTFDDRFHIVYVPTALGAPEHNAMSSVYVLNQPQHIVVESREGNLDTVEIVDVLGRTIYVQKQIQNTTIQIPSQGYHQAVLVKITLSDGTRTVKKTRF